MVFSVPSLRNWSNMHSSKHSDFGELKKKVWPKIKSDMSATGWHLLKTFCYAYHPFLPQSKHLEQSFLKLITNS